MVLLPIVTRELRVAARKPSTFWVRLAAAITALVIGGAFFTLATFGAFGVGIGSYGTALFTILTWLTLAAMLSAGLFFTSDCLSEEKREGTIGFLFLTDLRGYDVVLGKLMATSLRAFYALLAVLPVLGITLMMGGVTGTEFWKTALALVNALWLSLACGLFVSAISRDSQKAMAGTLLLVLLLTLGGPIVDGTIAATARKAFEPTLSLASPGYLFVSAGAWGRTAFWPALLVNQLIALTLLALSCVLLPRSWQEKARTAAPRARQFQLPIPKRDATRREKLLTRNPILWLASRGRWQMVFFWTVALASAITVAIILSQAQGRFGWIMGGYIFGLLNFAIYLVITSQACRFFVDTQRSGFLELLLVTPLTVKQIVQGVWHTMLRMFGWALALYLAARLAAALMTHLAWAQMAATVPTPAPPVPPPPATIATNSTTPPLLSATNVTTSGTTTTTTTVTVAPAPAIPPALNLSLAGGVAFIQALTIAANLAALIWFGMWMGLASRRSNLATLKTFVFVQVIPAMVLGFATMIIVPLLLMPSIMRGGAATFSMTWYHLLLAAIPALLAIAKDAGFILWSRKKLYTDFRARATRAPINPQSKIQNPKSDLPPPLPPVIPHHVPQSN